jgi:hypothetical protein
MRNIIPRFNGIYAIALTWDAPESQAWWRNDEANSALLFNSTASRLLHPNVRLRCPTE